MTAISTIVTRFIFVFLLSTVAAVSVSAQLTIINTPSTDTLQAKKFYIEADFLAKPTSYRRGGFQSYGYRTVYGLNKKTEAGVSFFYTRNGVNVPLEGQFSLKRKLVSNEKRGIASAIGVTAFIPLNKAAGSRKLAMIYGNFSKTLTRLKGLRLTAGTYRILNGGRTFGSKTGVTLAVEQPISKRVSFVGDWYSGRNRFGYSAAGVTFAITKRQFITVSYNFGNSGAGNNYLYIFYSFMF